MSKYIALIDCDSFFCSCERKLNPELNCKTSKVRYKKTSMNIEELKHLLSVQMALWMKNEQLKCHSKKSSYDENVQYLQYSQEELYNIFASKIIENLIIYCNNKFMRIGEIAKEFNLPINFVAKIVNGPHSVISFPLCNGNK